MRTISMYLKNGVMNVSKKDLVADKIRRFNGCTRPSAYSSGLMALVLFACLSLLVHREIGSLEENLESALMSSEDGGGVDEFDNVQIRQQVTVNLAHGARKDSKVCSAIPPKLMGVQFTDEELSDLDSSDLRMETVQIDYGGSWSPNLCQPKQTLSIVIPYKNRKRNLNLLLSYLHPFLQRQQRDYAIFILEQAGKIDGNSFNKGRVMNTGFHQVMKIRPKTNCIVFQDVDLLPKDDRNLYECDVQNPTHLSPAVDEFNYQLPYDYLIGGALAVTPDQFIAVNGYSNNYWGWGGEDDDLYKRFNVSGFTIKRPKMKFGRYWALPHKKRKAKNSPLTDALLGVSEKRMLADGLKNVFKFTKVIRIRRTPIYTHLFVDAGPAPILDCNATHCNDVQLKKS